ncbi:neuropeptide CCHamide-1 receptor [Aplysia californica]|uniref:Neuropeptide CCHamide-1 receptor n=1 Tax=Aplysia californica TaxID=6500 RepID=A0ABM0JH30_APLCA|nr:neuropeptide CCHamide-1 receptor [Aplysia californica]
MTLTIDLSSSSTLSPVATPPAEQATAAAVVAASLSSLSQLSARLPYTSGTMSHPNNSTNVFGTTSANATEVSNDTEIDYTFDRWGINSDLDGILVPIVFGIIFVVGLVGNGTLIISVVANKVMRNVPNILIVSLSVGDFLLILISVPVASTLYTFINWPYGWVVCKANHFLQTVSLGVSVFTLTALSADRYVAIVDPMAKLAGRTQRTTIAVAVAIWVVSIVLAIPDAVFSTVVSNKVEHLKTIVVSCAEYPPEMSSIYPRVFTLIHLFIFFILPILTISFFYAMMARILIRSSDSVPTESKTGAANHQRQIAARKKVAHVVLSFVIIFIVCWLPRYVYVMWFHFDPSDYSLFWHTFKITAFCLKFINSCVNPFALYFLSGQFRKFYNRYLFCCCRRVRYTSLEPTSTMHHLHSTTRRSSPTNMSMVHSQSMC